MESKTFTTEKVDVLVPGFTRKGCTVLAEIGLWKVVFNKEHGEMFAIGARDTERFLTVTEKGIELTHDSIMDGFAYFLHHYVFDEQGARVVSALTLSSAHPIWVPTEFFFQRVMFCTDASAKGKEIRSLYGQILALPALAKKEDQVRLFEELKQTVKEYVEKKQGSKPEIPLTVYRVPKKETKKETV